jgi:hypothetical protein
MEKLHGRDDLNKPTLHPGLIFMGERLNTVIREVGHGAHYTATPSHSWAVDLLVHISARSHVRYTRQPTQGGAFEDITKQLSMGAKSLMEDDKFLLECNLTDIVTTNGEQQEYWLLAIQAAQEAGQLRTQAKQQQCNQIP